MIANSKKLEWQGGSFRPNGARSGYGEEGARLAKNFTRWSSNEMILAARIFVGFNVGQEPVYTLEDLVEIVKNARWAQTGDPSSTFIAQRGVYRHEGGEVVEEDGAQVIILNTEEMPYKEFVDQMITLAEAIAERMKQEEVIVEIQRGGITQQVLGVGAGRMAPNISYPYWDVITPEEYVSHRREAKSDPHAVEEIISQQEMEFAREYPGITGYEARRARRLHQYAPNAHGDIRIEFGVIRLDDDAGWVPAIWEVLTDTPPHLLTSIPPRGDGDDREDAQASALSLAQREASHYIGDWNISIVPIEEMTQAEAIARARRYHMRHRPNADWEATGRIAYRGRDAGGPSVETSLDTRADERPGARIDYKLVPNMLRSRSTPHGAAPLTEKQDEDAYAAGYDAASLFSSSRVPTDLDDIFLFTLLHDQRVPNVNEEDPQFWEWRFMVREGAGDYLEAYPPGEPDRAATQAFRRRYGLV